MSQSSYTIADADGATVLSALNTLFAAIQSANSGGTGPSTTVPGMPWLDTSGATPVRRRRNAANSGWDLDDLPAVGMGVTSLTAVGSCDALTLGGAYLASSGATGAPVGGTAFIVYHGVGATSSDAVQEAFALGSDRIFSRRKVAGTWQAWVESPSGATATGLAVLQATTQAAGRTALAAYGATDLADAAAVSAATAGKILDAAVFTANKLKLGTAQATTSGTTKDFTGIPAWANRVTVLFGAVSLSGTAYPVVQLGTSGGIETTGYDAYGSVTLGSTAALPFTTGFPFYDSGRTATSAISGRMTFHRLSGNQWIGDGIGADGDNTASTYTMGGTKTLSGALDRIRITSSNGTDTFDAGSVNVMWE